MGLTLKSLEAPRRLEDWWGGQGGDMGREGGRGNMECGTVRGWGDQEENKIWSVKLNLKKEKTNKKKK